MTENAPRSCSGARTRGDHRRGDPVPPEPGPARSARTAPSHLAPNLAGAGPWRARSNTRRAPREAACLIMSHAAVSRTAAMLGDHARDRDHGRSPRSGQRRCSVVMPANMITDDRPCRERLPGDPDREESGAWRVRCAAFPLEIVELVPSRLICVPGRTCAVLRNGAARGGVSIVALPVAVSGPF